MPQYACPNPRCGAVLRNPVHMAGRSDTCPACGQSHVVPRPGGGASPKVLLLCLGGAVFAAAMILVTVALVGSDADPAPAKARQPKARPPAPPTPPRASWRRSHEAFAERLRRGEKFEPAARQKPVLWQAEFKAFKKPFVRFDLPVLKGPGADPGKGWISFRSADSDVGKWKTLGPGSVVRFSAEWNGQFEIYSAVNPNLLPGVRAGDFQVSMTEVKLVEILSRGVAPPAPPPPPPPPPPAELVTPIGTFDEAKTADAIHKMHVVGAGAMNVDYQPHAGMTYLILSFKTSASEVGPYLQSEYVVALDDGREYRPDLVDLGGDGWMVHVQGAKPITAFEKVRRTRGDHSVTRLLFQVPLGTRRIRIRCGGKETRAEIGPSRRKVGPRNPVDQTAVKSALVSMVRVIGRGDDEEFVQWVDGTDVERAFLRQAMPAVRKMLAWDRAGASAYGDHAWRKAKGPGGNGLFGGLGLATVAEIGQDVAISGDGDAAVCVFTKRGRGQLSMVRRNGKWLAVLPGGITPPRDAGQRQLLEKMVQAMGQVADRTRLMIGQPGVTAEDVVRAMGEGLKKISTPTEK